MNRLFSLVSFQFRKKSNIFSIFIIGIVISIALINIIYDDSRAYAWKNNNQDNIDFRVLKVNKDNNDEKFIDELSNMDYVNNVVYAFEYLGHIIESDTFDVRKLTGEFSIIPATNKTLPEIVKGTGFPDDENFYMVCPENFYPTTFSFQGSNPYSIFDKFKIDKYLNKNINVKFYGKMYFSSQENNSEYVFNTDIKLVGLYKNSDYNIDEFVCYVNNNFSRYISSMEYKDMEEQYNAQKYGGFMVEVDSIKHVDTVKEKLESEGFTVEPIAFLDPDIDNVLDDFNKDIVKTTEVLLLLLFIFIIIIYEKDFIENIEYYKLLNIVGYERKKVVGIYIFSNILKTIFCIIIGILLSLLICGGAYLLLKIFPFLMYKYKIIINLKRLIEVILLFVVISVISSIASSLIHLKKVGKYE